MDGKEVGLVVNTTMSPVLDALNADHNVSMKVEPSNQPVHIIDDSSRSARLKVTWERPGHTDECQDIKTADAAVLRNLEGSEQEALRGTEVAWKKK